MTSFGKRNLNPLDDEQRSVVRRQVSDGVITRGEPDEEPYFVRLATDKQWPLGLAVLIPFGILISMIVGGGLGASSLLYIVPGMAVLGVLLFFSFRSMQKGFAEEKEEREFSSKYTVLVIAGMFAGLLYFMFTQQMGIAEILALDWSSAIGGTRSISAPEPLTHTLFGNIAFGGAVPFVLYQLIKRFSGDS